MKSSVLPRPQARKTFTIALGDTFSETLAIPITIPEAEPPDPQYEWTIAGNELPVFSHTPKSVIYVANFDVGGINNDAASRTVSYRMVKHDGAAWVSVATGSYSFTAARHYTWNCFFDNVVVGDRLGVKLWCTTAGHTVDRQWQARVVMPTRVFPTDALKDLKPCLITNTVLPPTWPGTATSTLHSNLYIVGTLHPFEMTSGSYTFPHCVISATTGYGIFRIGLGDRSFSNTASYGNILGGWRTCQGNVPTSIIYRSYGEID